jgi:peptide/nickel transport system substrate-binding protein
LGFVAGKFDMTFSYSLTVPLLNDAKNQLPQAICEAHIDDLERDALTLQLRGDLD